MYRGLIISQLMEHRLRLQKLLDMCYAFTAVDSAHDFKEADLKLNSDQRIDFIFISNHFDQMAVATFVEAARASRAGKTSSLVLVTHSDSEEPDDIANNMIVGIHGFLCEPLSIDKIREVCGLAAGVQQQDSHTRLRAAAGLMLTGIMEEFQDDAEANGFGDQPKNLWEKVQRSCDAYRTVTGESLTNVVVNKLCDVSPTERMPNYDGVSKRVRMLFRERFRSSLRALNTKIPEKEPNS